MPLEQIVGVKTVRVRDVHTYVVIRHRSSITVTEDAMEAGIGGVMRGGGRSPSKTENHSISISTEILCLLYDTKKHLLSMHPPADTRGFGKYY
jgi:hypothetical protein